MHGQNDSTFSLSLSLFLCLYLSVFLSLILCQYGWSYCNFSLSGIFFLPLISCHCLLTFTQTAFSWSTAFNILLCWLHTEGDSPWFVSISQINSQLHLECAHSWSTLFSFGKSYDVHICLWICIGELGTKVCVWGVCVCVCTPLDFSSWLLMVRPCKQNL